MAVGGRVVGGGIVVVGSVDEGKATAVVEAAGVSRLVVVLGGAADTAAAGAGSCAVADV